MDKAEVERIVEKYLAITNEVLAREIPDLETAIAGYYEAAELLWDNGQKERARLLVQKILAIDPSHHLAIQLVGGYPYDPPDDLGAAVDLGPIVPPVSDVCRLQMPDSTGEPQ